ncbi:MAG: hypothetical protein IJM15_04090 [Erysipelotrichaceae bacterium]|nr:hypothetical protein [Erysipelotrichaceae bacterium]
MHLIGVREEDGWAVSRWELTYPAGWLNIQKAVESLYDYYSAVKVFVRDKEVDVKKAEDIMGIEENADMTIQGYSEIIKVPMIITFYNQISAVDVTVAQATEEFQNLDYEKFNHSLCQYLDSVELAMHR